MKGNSSKRGVARRSVLKAGLVLGAAQVVGPFVIKARGEEPVKIGLDNPLTGTYAAPGKNELIGCQLAVEQINAKGGILGRQVQLLVEDSTSAAAVHNRLQRVSAGLRIGRAPQRTQSAPCPRRS